MEKLELQRFAQALAVAALIGGCSAPRTEGIASDERESDPDTLAATGYWKMAAAPASATAPSSETAAVREMAATRAVTSGFTFDPPVQFRREIGPDLWAPYESLVVGDFNGDGRADVAATSRTNATDVYLQAADGSLGPPSFFQYGTGGYLQDSYEIVKGDFDEDGIPDVVYSTVSPTGTFGGADIVSFDPASGQLVATVAAEPDSLYGSQWKVMDVDRDQHLDIVSIFPLSAHLSCGGPVDQCAKVRVMYGDGTGKFDRRATLEFRINKFIGALAVEDLNDDGLSDLVMAVGRRQFGHGDQVFVALGAPAGGQLPPTFLFSGYTGLTGGHIAFADLNGDGIIDGLVSHFDPSQPRWVYYGTKQGQFGPAQFFYTLPPSPDAPLVADLDGDRRADVAFNHILSPGVTGLGVYTQENGALQAPWYVENQQMPVPNTVTAYGVGDLNSDGCRDVAVAATTQSLMVYYGRNCKGPGLTRLDESEYRWRQQAPPSP